ncbi:hypothetical protein Q5P01_011833 [Channa striata]|uniref:Gamma-aminobutyric acid type B receptor subunit 2 n=1 Tax=Channa striata TaxID=64152 RepID=A0AA88SW24_CHASR|nr:hypothetical protein Q5P01_011833 [Channa striata]
MEVSRLVLMLLSWLLVGSASAQVRHPLPVLWMMSGGGNLTNAVAPAVRLALQDLKRQAPPLGNYEVQLQLLDSQCDPPGSLKALFDAMWAGPKYLLLFGGVCPPVTALIARSLPALSLVQTFACICRNNNKSLLQVSFGVTSPSLSNRKWYGNLFSTMPSDRALNQAAVKLLQRYKWTRVGIITQEGSRLWEMKNDLMRQLLKADVHVISTQSLSADACSSLKRLKERDVRIIIGQFEEDSASEVFCCAYRLNLFGPRYQWIVVDGGSGGWRLGRQQSGCTADSLLMAADGSIRLQIRQLSNKNAAGVSGRTPVDYQDSYLRQLTQEGLQVGRLHPFAYDAVWVAARALGQVMEAVKHREKYGVQRNVTVSEEEVQKMLLEALKSTNFEGVTGPVFFRNGERMTLIELIQFQGGGVLVGEFNTSSQQLRLMHHLLKFKGPGPARDRALVRLQQRHVSPLLLVMVSSAAAVTISISLCITLCLRSSLRSLTGLIRVECHSCCSPSVSRPPRSSGGPQDQLLLLGVLLSSSSVLVSSMDGSSVPEWMLEISCSVRLWTLSVGHTVVVTSLFTRSWRVYSVVSIRQKTLGTFVLLSALLLDALVLTSWQTLDPLRRVVTHHNLELSSQDLKASDEILRGYFFQTEPADPDVIVRPFSEHCSSTDMDLWLTAVYGFKAPLMGLGCFVAWSIRSVQVEPPAVSSKRLTLSMFTVTAFSAPPVQFCLSSILILCCNVFVVSWMFGPTLVSLWCGGSERQQPSEPQEDGGSLSRLNQQLKSRTAQLDVEVDTLTALLSETLHLTSLNDEDQDGNSERRAPGPDGINSPEHVRRRLSVQLPILHHSYLPVVGGVSSSSSSSSGVFGSQEELMTTITSCPADSARLCVSMNLNDETKIMGRSVEHNYDLLGSDLTRLYNSPVDYAERMKRPLGDSSSWLGPISHSGVRVTLADGTKWLIHKGDGYGRSSQTVVTDARHMSSAWEPVSAKNFGGTRSVYEFVAAGGSNYNLLWDNCHLGSRRMMNQ